MGENDRPQHVLCLCSDRGNVSRGWRLDEGQGRDIAALVGAQNVKASLNADTDWTEGIAAAKAFQKKPGTVLKFADIGDRENNEPFSCAVWVKLAANNGGGAIVARMDDGNDYRGWDIWIGGKSGRHPSDQQVANRRAESRYPRGVDCPDKWQHIIMTYDGGKKKESIHIYMWMA